MTFQPEFTEDEKKELEELSVVFHSNWSHESPWQESAERIVSKYALYRFKPIKQEIDEYVITPDPRAPRFFWLWSHYRRGLWAYTIIPFDTSDFIQHLLNTIERLKAEKSTLTTLVKELDEEQS